MTERLHWVRFQHDGRAGFGTLSGDAITVYDGEMFAQPKRTDKTVALGGVTLLTPSEPSKMVGLVNNFRALLTKLNQPVPEEPLYFLKAPSAFMAAGGTIEQRIQQRPRELLAADHVVQKPSARRRHSHLTPGPPARRARARARRAGAALRSLAGLSGPA